VISAPFDDLWLAVRIYGGVTEYGSFHGERGI